MSSNQIEDERIFIECTQEEYDKYIFDQHSGSEEENNEDGESDKLEGRS